MFDLGFWELMLIAVIALLVVGPERLPGLARNAGLWVGRLRRFLQSVKRDIEQELAAEELQRTLKKQAGIHELEEITEEIQSSIDETKDTPGSGGAQSAETAADAVSQTGAEDPKSHDPTR